MSCFLNRFARSLMTSRWYLFLPPPAGGWSSTPPGSVGFFVAFLLLALAAGVGAVADPPRPSHRRADGLELAGQQLPRRPTHFARRRTPPLSLPSSRINQECGHKDPLIGRFLAADGARDKEETLEGGNRHLFIHYPA